MALELELVSGSWFRINSNHSNSLEFAKASQRMIKRKKVEFSNGDIRKINIHGKFITIGPTIQSDIVIDDKSLPKLCAVIEKVWGRWKVIATKDNVDIIITDKKERRRTLNREDKRKWWEKVNKQDIIRIGNTAFRINKL